MKRFLAIFLSVMITAGNVCAFELPTLNDIDDEDVTFIVEVEGDAALVEQEMRADCDLRTVTDEILNEQAQVMDLIKKEVSEETKKGFVYTALFNGFSIDGKRGQLDEIKKLDGVKNVYISQKTPVPEPMLSSAGKLTSVQSAYDGGYSGQGQVIAVIDAFCDTSHDFFSTSPVNPKYSKQDIDGILKSKELNSKTESANQVYISDKIPYAYNYATNSADTYSKTQTHGTHVTGIAAGKNGTTLEGDTFSGVAYDAQILFMSASKNGYLYDDMIFAALNDAALLEADVINMSFGSGYYDSALSEAYEEVVENAKKSGISLVAAAGNSSRGYNDVTPLTANTDYSSVGKPACLEQVTAVASADNTETKIYRRKVSVNGEEQTVLLYSDREDSVFSSLIKDNYIEYEYCGLGNTSDFVGKNLSGKIALIDRGEITFTQKASNAKKAGASGIIFANMQDSVFTISDVALPAVTATKSAGAVLASAANKSIIQVEGKYQSMGLVNGGKISDYSSWGVDSSLELKPEITAPGGNIYSSLPDNKYEYLSGTSMAAPHISGIYALARQYYEKNPYISSYNNLDGKNLVNLIENIAMSSAEVIRDENGTPYSPRVQGAGMASMKNILNEKVMLTGNSGKAKLSLGEISDSFDVSFTITNISNETVKFDKISLDLITDGYFEQNGEYYVGNSVNVKYDTVSVPEQITIGSGEEYTFCANVKMNKAFLDNNKSIFENGFFVDGFITFDTDNGSNYASMPFTGYYGDWYNIPIFDSTTYDEGGSSLAEAEYPYETGTLLKAYVSDSSYAFVGRNMIDKTIVDKKYISYSNEAGTTLALDFKNYRTASNFAFVIEDENKNTVYSQGVKGPCNKFISYTYRFDKNKMSALEEGKYNLYVGAIANGSNEINDVMTLPIVIDNTSPEIISASYDDVTKLLTVSAKDNHYLSYFVLKYDGNGSGYVPIYEDDEVNGLVTKIIDLSTVSNPKTVKIGACDYAMNYTEKPLSLLDDKVGAELENYISTSSVTSFVLLMRNNTSDDITADVYVAFYDENLKLIAVSEQESCVVQAGKEKELPYSMLENTQKATTAKAFVWNSDSINPIDTAKVFSLR